MPLGSISRRQKLTRYCWLALAYASLAMALLAIAIPGIPSTEFVLLSAWAASKSSPRLQHWIESHRLFGPLIHNWRNGRVISRRAKITASACMSGCLAIMFWTIPQRWVIAVAALGMSTGVFWMWSRPSSIRVTDGG